MKKSSAATYRELRAKQQKKEEIFEVTSPSGMVWKLKKPKIENYLLSGTLPLGMITKYQSVNDGSKSQDEVFDSLSESEQIKAIDLGNRLVRDICVDPKIVDNPQAGDEIGANEILLEDYVFLAQWASSGVGGGAEAAGLGNFRGK